MTYKDILAILGGAAILLMALDKGCHTPVTPPDIQTTSESRNKHVDSSNILEPIVKEIVRDRWKIKHHYDTIIQTVLMYDSAETDQAFDSLIGTKNNAVVIYYKGKRDSIQLVRMDSVHVIDTMRISLLRKANLDCDTLLASKDKTITELKKHGKKQYVKGFIHGIGVGSIGTLLIVK